MSGYRVSEQATAELDSIWLYVARDSNSIEIANTLIDSITARFWRLASQPHMGRDRTADLGKGLRSFPAGNYTILYEIAQDHRVHILRVIDSRRDIPALLRKSPVK